MILVSLFISVSSVPSTTEQELQYLPPALQSSSGQSAWWDERESPYTESLLYVRHHSSLHVFLFSPPHILMKSYYLFFTYEESEVQRSKVLKVTDSAGVREQSHFIASALEKCDWSTLTYDMCGKYDRLLHLVNWSILSTCNKTNNNNKICIYNYTYIILYYIHNFIIYYI